MFIFLAIVCLRILGAASASCYDIRNVLVTKSDYLPCNNAAGSVSMCCGTNRGSKSSATPDTCLQNGLCQNVGRSGTTYWREGCSDKTWNSPFCLKGICTSDIDINFNGQMSPCDGTATSAKWCCGTSKACCGTGKEILLAAVLGGSDTKTSSTTSPAAAPPPPPPPPPPPGPAATSPASVAAANIASIDTATIAALTPQSPVAGIQSQETTTSTQATVTAQGGVQSNSASQVRQAQSEPTALGATQVTAQGISYLETSQQANPGSPLSKTVKAQTIHTINNVISEASTTPTISGDPPGPSSIPATSSGLSTAAKTGIGISLAILAIMAIAAVVLFSTRRSSRHDVTEIIAYRPETKSYAIPAPAPVYPMAQVARAARDEVRQVGRRDKYGRLLSPTGSAVRD